MQKTKDYIRRAKAWRNSVWSGSKDGKPSSFLMSLLVVRAYENAGRDRSEAAGLVASWLAVHVDTLYVRFHVLHEDH